MAAKLIHPKADPFGWPVLIDPTYKHGETVKKKSGALWRGKIVGWYSTDLTPEGYAVESIFEPGSVQIYPAHALERLEDS